MQEDRDKTAGFLLLRLFFGVLWLGQFWGKLYDQESHIAAWRNLGIWAAHLTEWFAKQTALPGWAVRPYAMLVPYLELGLGFLWLTGVEMRKTILFSALLIISLSFGMLMQLKHDVVALNTIYLLALVLALQWEKHNRWSLDQFLGPRRP